MGIQSASPMRHGKLAKRPCADNVERLPSASATPEHYEPSELLLLDVSHRLWKPVILLIKTLSIQSVDSE